jgi:hypothetical protein
MRAALVDNDMRAALKDDTSAFAAMVEVGNRLSAEAVSNIIHGNGLKGGLGCPNVCWGRLNCRPPVVSPDFLRTSGAILEIGIPLAYEMRCALYEVTAKQSSSTDLIFTAVPGDRGADNKKLRAAIAAILGVTNPNHVSFELYKGEGVLSEAGRISLLAQPFTEANFAGVVIDPAFFDRRWFWGNNTTQVMSLQTEIDALHHLPKISADMGKKTRWDIADISSPAVFSVYLYPTEIENTQQPQTVEVRNDISAVWQGHELDLSLARNACANLYSRG